MMSAVVPPTLNVAGMMASMREDDAVAVTEKPLVGTVAPVLKSSGILPVSFSLTCNVKFSSSETVCSIGVRSRVWIFRL